ncbi:hypothetical protein IKL64_04325 [bacterium]|nr:hypothetical protein [bacterium]
MKSLKNILILQITPAINSTLFTPAPPAEDKKKASKEEASLESVTIPRVKD